MLLSNNPSKFDMWHYGDFWVKSIIFLNIDLHHPLWLFISYGLKLWRGIDENWHVTLIEFWKKKSILVAK
jgi:hypothetical protein